jgi:hypothetical protein
MTTLVPTSSQQQPGTTSATSTGVESYEDMFVNIMCIISRIFDINFFKNKFYL